MGKMKFTLLLLVLVFLHGCNEPETIVTNVVHPDGSITRKVEMRTSKREFDPEEFRVPVDSTWTHSYSFEVSEGGDTTRVLVAEKLFPDAGSITEEYSREWGSANSALVRSAIFRKSFRWFTTSYRFTEKVQRSLPYGYPVSNFLSNEEVEYLMLPGSVADDLREGADSIYYSALGDSVEAHIELWFMKGWVNGWVLVAGKMLEEAGADEEFIGVFQGYENKLLESMDPFESSLSSILLSLLGEETMTRYGSVFDAAEDSVEINMELFWSFGEYTVKTLMPGNLKDCNGYISASGEVAWQVRPELYFFEDYTMWAESHRANRWAWYVSGGFVLLVAAGIVIRKIYGR